MIKRGAVISKYILALVILANDSKLLEIIDNYAEWEDDSVYTDYQIGDYIFNIFHICSLTKFDSFKMMQILLRKLPGIDINARVEYVPGSAADPNQRLNLEDTGDQTPNSEVSLKNLATLDPSSSTIITNSQVTPRKSKSNRSSAVNSRASKFNKNAEEEEVIPNLKFIGCRPIDLAILKKNYDYDTITLLSRITDRFDTCPIYRGHNVETRLNFMQLGMSVHGSDLAVKMTNLESETIEVDAKKINKKEVKIVDPYEISTTRFQNVGFDIFTLYNIIDIQYAPLKFSGDAEKRLQIMDHILEKHPEISLCQASVNLEPMISTDTNTTGSRRRSSFIAQESCEILNSYPSKTIVDYGRSAII